MPACSFHICLKSLREFARKHLQQVNLLNKVKKWKRRRSARHGRLFSDFNWLASSSAAAAVEVSGQLRQVFKLIDANEDGLISPLELSELLVSLGHERSEAIKEAEGMVREMDCNGDGLVDMEEFLSTVMTSNTTDDGRGGEEEDGVLMDAFVIFDSDNNGLISAKELQRVLASLGCRDCNLRECRRMINGVDKNGDGFVDFEEFRSMMTAGYCYGKF